MIQKHVRRFGKYLLLAGFSLCSLAVLERGHEMVKALELDNNFLIPDSQQSDHLSPVTLPAQLRPPVQASSPTPQPAHPTNTHAASSQTAQPQTVALNMGRVNDPQQPIATLEPAQIAASEWYGASFPVEDFQAYTSPFGYRQSPDGGYTQEFHYGLDMAAPEGSYIRNWWGGKVVEVSDDSNCGTSVVLESGPWTHIYCHMQGHVEESDGKRYMIDREGGLQIWEGQQVPAGARIGRVGMTGRTTGPHLHWGLKYDSNWVDPAFVLMAMYASQQQTATR